MREQCGHLLSRDTVLPRRLQVVAQCVTSSALADKRRDRREIR